MGIMLKMQCINNQLNKVFQRTNVINEKNKNLLLGLFLEPSLPPYLGMLGSKSKLLYLYFIDFCTSFTIIL